MKTIEERSEEYAETWKGTPHSHFAEECFIAGATDHHTIVRERVCKWICANCECAENCEFSSPANCPTIKSITKAMEGEE